MTVNTEQLVRSYLDDNLRHMTLATVGENGMPLATELDFVVRPDDLALCVRSLATSLHIQNANQDPRHRVAGTIVRQHEDGEPTRGVAFAGTLALVGAGEEQDQIAALFAERRGADAEKILATAASGGHQFYRIDVGEWRFRGAPPEDGKPQTYVLPWDPDALIAIQ